MSDNDTSTSSESDTGSDDYPDHLPKPPFFMVISGARGSGKTTLEINLLYNELAGRFVKIYMFSSTFKVDPAYKVIQIPPEQVFDDYNDATVRKILKDAMEDGHEEEDKPPILIIFDDVVGSANFKKSITTNGTNALSLLALRGRHYNISCIVLTQCVRGISPEVRSNTDCAIVFSTTNEKELEAIFESYGFGKKKTWMKLFTSITSTPRGFYMIHLTSQDWNHKVFNNFTPIKIKHTY